MTSNPSKATRVVFVLAVVGALASSSPRAAQSRSAHSVEMEDMRRELRQLRAQIQTLRAAMSEMAELDKQKAVVLARVLKNLPGGADATGRSEANDSAGASASSAPTMDLPVPAPALVPRRVAAASPPAPAEPAVGTIKGKVAVPSGEPVAYVYVENVVAPAAKGQRVVIAQKGKKFVPSWAVVQRGTAISFPNLDNIYHNVFSLSSGNSFDLGLYNSANDAKAHVFNEPGAVDIYCNIHPEMTASALVVPNRHYAKVKADGTFEIANVPRGKRKVVAWAPGAQLTADWADVEAGRTVEVSLRLSVKGAGHLNKAGQKYGSYE